MHPKRSLSGPWGLLPHIQRYRYVTGHEIEASLQISECRLSNCHSGDQAWWQWTYSTQTGERGCTWTSFPQVRHLCSTASDLSWPHWRSPIMPSTPAASGGKLWPWVIELVGLFPCLSCSQQPWSFKRPSRERAAALSGKERVPAKLFLRLSEKLIMNKIWLANIQSA